MPKPEFGPSSRKSPLENPQSGLAELLPIALRMILPPPAVCQGLHDRRHNRRIYRTADAQTRPRRKHDLKDARWHRLRGERRRVGRDLES